MRDTTDASAIFAPIWKRKWIILLVGVIVAVGSYAYYKRQPAVYAANTQLNLASGSEEQGQLGGITKAGVPKSQILNAATIITSALVAEEAHKSLAAEKGGKVKGKVRVKTAASGSDIVTITAEAHGAKKAARLANAYALAYIKHEQAAYVREVKGAIRNTKAQLRRIEISAAAGAKKGQTNGTAVIQEAALSSKLNQLEASLGVSGIQQISPAKAKTAELIEPKPKSNAIFGFAIGIVLAMIAVFIVERFDRSIRSLGSVERLLGAPLLAALPKVKSPVVEADGRRRPSKLWIEPLRRAHATLAMRGQSAGEGTEPRVILCTSAEAGDGKSSVTAALALTKRDAGERVAVIEADFRRPVLARLLGVSAERGLADVLSGALTLDEAMQTVPGAGIVEPAGIEASAGGTVTRTRVGGSVSLLAAGPVPGGVPPMLNGAFAGIVGSIAEDYDCVLIDAPSPLEASDTLQLLGSVDGTILIARLGHTRDASAERLAEMLATPSAAPALGAIANDVPARELSRTGFAPDTRRGRFSLSRK